MNAKLILITLVASLTMIACTQVSNNDNNGVEREIVKPVNEGKIVETHNKKEFERPEGKWSSSEAKGYGFNSIEIIKKGNSYDAVLTMIDGSITTEYLIAKNKNGVLEYHTNNRAGEYYKLTSSGLGSYDRDGLIFTLYKLN